MPKRQQAELPLWYDNLPNLVSVTFDINVLPKYQVELRKEFVDSIKKKVLHPILVIKLPDGNYHVVDGKRRLEAARLAGNATIEARVCESTSAVGSAITLISNQQRYDNPVGDYEAIIELVSIGLNLDTIRIITGMPLGTIHKRLQLGNLLPELRAAIPNGIRTSIADIVAKMQHEQQLMLLSILNQNGRIKHADVMAIKRHKKETLSQELPDDMFELPKAKSYLIPLELVPNFQKMVETYKNHTNGDKTPEDVRLISILE